MPKIPSYLLNLAGEYRICSELNKRGIFATVTYGTRKGVDVYAISDRRSRALKIEVKTSQGAHFVTSLSQKSKNDDPNEAGFWDRRADDPDAPDFWVLFQITVGKDETFGERFFVLSHREICAAQAEVNKAYADKYFARHGKKPDLSAGVDNVRLENVVDFENKWHKIVDQLCVPAGSNRNQRAIAENELIEFLLPLNPPKPTSELETVYMQEGHRIHEVIERLGATTAGVIHRETQISIPRIIDHIQWALAQDPPRVKFTVLKI